MPREAINQAGEYWLNADESGGGRVLSDVPLPEGSSVFSVPIIEVNWSRMDESDSDFTFGVVGLSVEFDSDWLWHRVTGPCSDRGTTTLPTQVLSRKEINHLIRTLKRARDAAYGADE